MNIKKHAHYKSLLACSFVGIRRLSCVAMRRSKRFAKPLLAMLCSISDTPNAGNSIIAAVRAAEVQPFPTRCTHKR